MADDGIPGLTVVEAPGGEDERGSMRRFFDAEMAEALGIPMRPRQVAVARNAEQGTLRGLHYQASPSADAKFVSCLHGRIFDVIVDLRPESPWYRRWRSIELDADRPRTLCIPAGCAHGYLTLVPDTEVLYVIDAPYRPGLQRGVRWDDPVLAIDWPAAPSRISERDRALPHLE